VINWLGELFRKAWRGFLLFLEVVDLRQVRYVDQTAMLARFKLYHTEFRRLLSANNSFLETLTEFDPKIHSPGRMDRNYLKHKVVRALADVHNMIESLNTISEQRYPDLYKAFDRIAATLTEQIEELTAAARLDLVLDLSEIRASHADVVGGKMANLAELRNVLELPTPDGFVITMESFRMLIEEGGLRSWIENVHLDLSQSTPDAEIQRISRDIRDHILNLTIPKAVQEAIRGALARLATRRGTNVPLAVRSSALGEDGELSFAGQYLSVLNVPAEEIFAAYLQVIASLYSPEAMHYRLLHGLRGESAEMAVGVIELVHALASGVVFSKDPNRPDSGQVLVQAVWGLSVTLVEGRTSPEIIFLTQESEPTLVNRIPAKQATRIIPGSAAKGEDHLKEECLPLSGQEMFCLTDNEASQLARWAMKIEAHFGTAQDIEWAMDSGRLMVLLQARLLILSAQAAREEKAIPDYPLLISGGDVACPGVGMGPAVHLNEDDNLDSFPAGGVLVTKRPSPKFVRLMAKAQAIVTDTGSTTGHMASVARELRVPTLLNTKTATRSIPPGTMVTVDAGGGFVYEGEITALCQGQADYFGRPVCQPSEREVTLPPFIEKIVSYMAPLNLIDPRSQTFTAEGCRTLHDLARYVHEKSFEEMFGLGEKLGDARAFSYFLDVFLPIDLYIIDLGGGLIETPKTKKVKRSQIASVPLAALLKGMLHKDIPRFGAKPMDLSGFFSIMMRHALNSPEQDRTFKDPCYALISDCYLNLTARVGYHFSVVDSYCSATTNKNYISFLFRGGAADAIRRVRRVRAIAGVLKEHGFAVEIRGDAVNARLSKTPQQEIASHLDMIGRLLQFFRQLDVSMIDEQATQEIQEAFLRGDYGLTKRKVNQKSHYVKG
jgi:pyruvate,water dikinase